MTEQRFIQDVNEALELIHRHSVLDDFAGSQAKLDRFHDQLENLVEVITAREISQLKLFQTLFPQVAEENYRFEFSKFNKTLKLQAEKAGVEFSILTDKSRSKTLAEKTAQIDCQTLAGPRAVKAQMQGETAYLDETIQTQGVPSEATEIKQEDLIFISYAESTEDEVKELLAMVKSQAAIKAFEARFWCFKNELLAGEDFDKQIQQALNDSAFGLLCCASDFFASDYIIHSELPYFNNRPLPDGRVPRQIPYIPIRLHSFELPNHQSTTEEPRQSRHRRLSFARTGD
ncbi:MAG: TIR domain-containing protein [Reinekea sp.]